MNSYSVNNEINHCLLFINVESFNLSNTKNVKFNVPTLMPGINGSSSIDNKTKTTNSHIMNKDDIPNENFTVCNYIVADIPHHIAKDCPHDANRNVRKGLEFIGVFMDGDITKPIILQRRY